MITLHHGDCLEQLKTLPDNRVDSVVTDPPYGLSFMGKKWDYDVPSVEVWQECLRVLKPGGHLLAFAGTRTQHRMAVRIEDAGFEIRDMIAWVYSTGFPKSLNIGKNVDKLQGNEREWISESPYKASDEAERASAGKSQTGRTTHPDITKGTSPWEGWGTALKPAIEPITLARKPLSEKNVAENCLKWGTGGINVDESRVGTDKVGWSGGKRRGNTGVTAGASNGGTQGGFNYGGGEARPVIGRFPANLIHDNSEEVRECFPETKSRQRTGKRRGKVTGIMGAFVGQDEVIMGHNDSGNASRFFKSILYVPKASKRERNAGCEGLEEKQGGSYEFRQDGSLDGKIPSNKNNHPTVKPVALMEYLIKMVTRKGGTVLDPFMGSGSTGVACKKNGYNFIGIEREEEYIKIAKARINNTHL